MIDPANLRYLSTYSSLIREAQRHQDASEHYLAKNDISAWSYYKTQAQSCMDEATRRFVMQQGVDHGQRQRYWMSRCGSLTPLL